MENVFIAARRILAAVSGTPSASVTLGVVVNINGVPAVYKFQKFIIQFHHVFHLRILLQARNLTVSANNPILPVSDFPVSREMLCVPAEAVLQSPPVNDNPV